MSRYASRYVDEGEVRMRWRDPRLAAVRVADLRAYLEQRSWKEAPTDREGFLAFEEPVADPDGPLYQFVPLDEGSQGFRYLVWQLLGTVAHIEGRYAGDVLTDVLRARAADANGAAHDPRVAGR